MAFQLRGVIPSLITPFTPDGIVDLDSVENLAEMEISAGANGLLLFDYAGAPDKLALPEMQSIVAAVARRTAGRVPVIVALADAEPAKALHLSVKGGVDAFLVPPPRTSPPDSIIKITEFRAFQRTARVPVILDCISLSGLSPLESAEASGLLKSLEDFPFVRVNQPPAGPLLSAIRERSTGQVTTVTGLAGLHLIDGLDRGASAVTTLSCLPEPFISIIKYREHGSLKEAGEAYSELLPLLTLVAQTPAMAIACEKILLARRRWIASDARRPPFYSPDSKQRSDLFTAFEKLANRFQLA